MYRALMPVYWATILGLPLTLAVAPVLLAGPWWLKLCGAFAAPFLFVVLYPATCGLLSLPHRGAIQQGEFPRDLANPLYARRRLYGLCWTAVYYFTPLYNLLLSVPGLKARLFRLFGYRGDTRFTTYPDTWIRDLPLLSFGQGAYLSNKATLGTNLYSVRANTILTGPICLGDQAMIGHAAIIGLGASLANKSELGMGSLFGLGASLGARSRTGPACAINHTARIGDDCVIEPMSYLGLRVEIGNGIRVPAGAAVPKDVVITSQDQVADFISSETRDLSHLRQELSRLLAERNGGGNV